MEAIWSVAVRAKVASSTAASRAQISSSRAGSKCRAASRHMSSSSTSANDDSVPPQSKRTASTVTPARRGRGARRSSSRGCRRASGAPAAGSSSATNSGSWLTMIIGPGQPARACADGGARRRVEVVGGLVEQQQVVPAGDELGQRQLGLLAAGERAGVLEGLVAGEAEHAEQGPEPLVVGRSAMAPHVVEHGRARLRCPRAPGRSSPADTLCPKRTSPASGSVTPARIRSSVVLPAPLRPMTSRRSPRSTSNVDVGEDRRAAVGLGRGRSTSSTTRPAVRRVREAHVQGPLLGRPGDRRRLDAARPACRGSWRPGPAWPWLAHGVGQVGQAVDLGRLGGRRAWPGAPRPRPDCRGTGCRCPCTRRCVPSSRCRTRVMASSSSSRSWLITSRAPR